MKHLFRPRTLQRPKPRYGAALMLLVPVIATVMMLTPMVAQASSLGTPTLTVSTSSAATPNSASGCNQSVCIAVCNNSQCTGSGLHIDHVSATGTTTARSGSVVGQMLVRGSVRETTNRIRWINPNGDVVTLTAFYPVGYNINNGSKVCVRFVGTGAPPGLPCETVRS